MSDILIMLLLCVESEKIPLLHKLYKCLPVAILHIYNANNIYTVQAVHQDGGLFLVYGIVITC